MAQRRPMIAGNWKMNKTVPEAVAMADQLKERMKDVTHSDILIAPPFVCLAPVSRVLENGNVLLGAQDLFWEAEGAYTGETSAKMLVSAGCRYVILGHSERRQYFRESDESVNRKIKAAIAHRLIPIVCVGETEMERELNLTFSILDKQIKKGLKDFFTSDLEGLIIAYEPVWAIGTGKTATTEQAQEVHLFLRELIKKLYGEALAEKTRILYGGSVKPANIAELMTMPDIDGALVGGASLDADTFGKIVKYK